MQPETCAASGTATPDGPILRSYMPELDVLRGLAILSVVVFHGLYWSGAASHTHGLARKFVLLTSGGWLGVNLFFVLSGFLITGILLDTKRRDDYFHRFYRRRALRILPIYLVTLAILAIDHGLTPKAFAVCILFLANYSTPLHAGLTYGVLWSLAVEEQFYIVWPSVIKRVSVQTLTWTAGALCVVEPILRWMSATHRIPLTDVHGNTLLILDNLAFGALAAVFARSSFGTRQYAWRLGGILLLIGTFAELAGSRMGILHRDNPFGSALQITPWNFIFTGILLLALCWGSPFAKSIWSAPLRLLGYVSYGLYLLHMIVFLHYDRLVARTGPYQALLMSPYVRLLLAGGAATGIAWLSRKYFEDWFLRIKVERGDKSRPLLRQTP
jgi:peptidoglycan/LPS O-acetylase OafA/YrhL